MNIMSANIKSIISQEKNIDSAKLTEVKSGIEKKTLLETVFKANELDVIQAFLDNVQKGDGNPTVNGKPNELSNYIESLTLEQRKTIVKYIDLFDFGQKGGESKSAYPQRYEDFDAFLKYRFEGQRSYFSKNSRKYKDAFYKRQNRILFLTVLIPIIVAIGSVSIQFTDNAGCIKLLSYIFNLITIVCSSIVAYNTSRDKLEDNQNNWRLNRESCEKLKQEFAYFEGKCGPYADCKDDENTRQKLFRERVEKCVEDNVSRFSSLNIETEKIKAETLHELEAYRKAFPDFKPPQD